MAQNMLNMVKSICGDRLPTVGVSLWRFPRRIEALRTLGRVTRWIARVVDSHRADIARAPRRPRLFNVVLKEIHLRLQDDFPIPRATYEPSESRRIGSPRVA